MTQYIGVEQSTDMREKRTVLKTFTSKKKALAWQAASPQRPMYTDPASARNWHHILRSVYEMPKGIGLATLKREVRKKDEQTPYNQRGMYYGLFEDRVASAVFRHGVEVRQEET